MPFNDDHLQPSLSVAHVAAETRTRRALRITTNSLTVLSMLICMAIVALWLRSYWVCDLVSYARPGSGNDHIKQSILGRLHLLTSFGVVPDGGASYRCERLGPQSVWDGRMSSYPDDVQWWLGFVWQTYEHTGFPMGQVITTSHRLIVVPYWFPAGVFALAPLAWLMRTRGRFGLLGVMILVAAIAVVLACLRPPAGS